jgi:hypothetical protein
MDWTNVFAAGGSVLGCLTNNPTNFEASDVDLFLVGVRTDHEANAVLKRVYDTINRNVGNITVLRTARAITLIGAYPFRHVQVILRLHKSPSEVLLGFDIDSCAVGFDGSRVLAAPRFRRALNKSYNLVNESRRSSTYEIRLRKYAKRGFRVLVPDLDKKRVSQAIFQKNPNNTTGLTKLLIYEYQDNTPLPAFSYAATWRRGFARSIGKDQFTTDALEEFEALQGEESDYSEVFVPWGPTWNPNRVVRMLESKEKGNFFNQIRQQREAKKFGATSAVASEGPRHKHLFITGGIDAAISGRNNSYWCRVCQQQQQQQSSFSIEKDASDKFVDGPLTWIKEKAVYQDIDGRFRRALFTGAFNQSIESWEGESYGGAPAPVSARQLFVPNLANKQTAPIQVSSGFVCVECNNSFPSENLLDRHRRLSGHGIMKKDIPKPAPAKKKVEFAVPIQSIPSPVSQVSTEPTPVSYITQPVYASSPVKPTTTFDFGPQPGVYTSDDPAPFSTTSSYSTPSYSSSYSSPSYSAPSAPSYSAAQERPASRKPFISSAVVEAPEWYHLFAGPSRGSQPGSSYSSQETQTSEITDPVSKLLLLINLLFKRNLVDASEKGRLKDLALAGNALLISALEVFETDKDFDEFADTAKRVVRHAK